MENSIIVSANKKKQSIRQYPSADEITGYEFENQLNETHDFEERKSIQVHKIAGP